eukprot:gnl/Trimastix_PCT/4429.p1 GENE.gnl/Trimastix_PCT/4429~~gnl/Trimastix_PCT/4429.p1  ORF type:complete len:504 (-),score=119.31 gnl/Trimastix_PCT/4429:118-1629(-)
MDPLRRAMIHLRHHKYDECLKMCTELLTRNPYDQAAWYLKCKCMVNQNYIDDSEMEEEGLGDMLLDTNATSDTPRPGTSVARPLTSRPTTSASGRPLSSTGRPQSGFIRPGTTSRPLTGSQRNITTALASRAGSRPGTSRPITSSGRLVRLGTASLAQQPPDAKICPEQLDFNKYGARPALAKVLCEYIIHVERNPAMALKLAAVATEKAEYKDWWWKLKIGKCLYLLGLYRDAEKQFKSSLRNQEMIITYLELCKVFWRLDQPKTALEWYMKGLETYAGDVSLQIGIARVYEAIGDEACEQQWYRKVLQFDASNVEAIACLGAHHFYSDQPELSIRFFRRLLQMGLGTPELWNNLALCCFYSGQYDMALSCFERALSIAEDDTMADIWYNLGHFAIAISDLGLAFQAFKIATSINGQHGESFNNLGVLEMRRGNTSYARSDFRTASRLAPFLYEPLFNGALLSFKVGEFQESYQLVQRALEITEQPASKELKQELHSFFTAL